jgi:hypothetical protein
MLSNARSYLIVAPHVATIPGPAIMIEKRYPGKRYGKRYRTPIVV